MKDYYDSGRTFSTYTTIDCPFKNKCTSANSFKCLSCRHNNGKRDYYDPNPWKPHTPYPEVWKPYSPFKQIYWPSSKQTPYFAD